MTLRTSFSPMKFLISTSQQPVSLFLSRLTLMGKLDNTSAAPNYGKVLPLQKPDVGCPDSRCLSINHPAPVNGNKMLDKPHRATRVPRRP